ncbi:conserved hypothetical protein [Thermosinus carboxydivorans Nor1]|uniref:DUF6385 domain-containing protein n=1 Tax=Thermosinus carboxydivorans Nor1 TaxID=401526 RepID=A1HSS0_9FIRM|nr:DUF6385 domain-containing protein [Thermosinus carboxydivorans]EAX46951.1 conserved hypothetical protein [Thermosinus carboxydivorans Nor1]
MPNFKIIQDIADQARVKVYGSQNLPLKTDVEGSLAITGPASGLLVTAPAQGLLVTAPAEGLNVTGPVGGLLVTAPSKGLMVTAPAEGLSITGPAGGLLVTAPANGLLVTSTGLSVVPTVATTDVSVEITGLTDTAGWPTDTYNVIGLRQFSFGIVNRATSAENAQATVKLQISPDGSTWVDNSSVVTLNQNSATALVASIFLKYARVYYAAVNAASTVDLSIFLQGQA